MEDNSITIKIKSIELEIGKIEFEIVEDKKESEYSKFLKETKGWKS